MRVSLKGTYENFKNMLHDIETNIRIFEVSQIALSPGAKKQHAAEEKPAEEKKEEDTSDIEKELGELQNELLEDAEEVPLAAPEAPEDEYAYGITVVTYYQEI